MKCPHCLVNFFDVRNLVILGEDSDGFWAIEKYACPNPPCKKSILYLIKADIQQRRTPVGTKYEIIKGINGEELVFSRKLIRPRAASRPPVPSQVPRNIAEDYEEACLVLPDSSKVSAALSRRCLQNLLRSAASVKHGDLANEIQEVLNSKSLPSHLAEGIDAIRNIGNFGAHPIKSKSTGEIVPVESGEAEWNLDVIESLFDFYYVQPAIMQQKRDALNAKLADMGKPAMK